MGASTMALLCADLEAAAGDPTIPGGTDILDRLDAEFDRVRPALTTAFPAADHDTADDPSGVSTFEVERHVEESDPEP